MWTAKLALGGQAWRGRGKWIAQTGMQKKLPSSLSLILAGGRLSEDSAFIQLSLWKLGRKGNKQVESSFSRELLGQVNTYAQVLLPLYASWKSIAKDVDETHPIACCYCSDGGQLYCCMELIVVVGHLCSSTAIVPAFSTIHRWRKRHLPSCLDKYVMEEEFFIPIKGGKFLRTHPSAAQHLDWASIADTKARSWPGL